MAEKEKKIAIGDIPLEQMFLASELIPDAAEAFLASSLPLKSAIDDADVVLDTSALLVPYGSGSESLKQITELFKKLAADNRLYIPAQAAREFVRNRPNKISELQQGLLDRMSQYVTPEMPPYPILEGLPEYVAMRKVLEQGRGSNTEFRKSINTLVDAIRDWEWNDPVSAAYRSVIKPEMILECTTSREQIRMEMAHRYELLIPPGYKDASKGDGGVGDFLIWKTILEIGSKNKRHVIFISGDEKPDWQYSSKGNAFLPRVELINEYRRASSGQMFYMIPLSRLLRSIEGESPSVADLQKAEERLTESQVLVNCPSCTFGQRVYIGMESGSSALPQCPNCKTKFHVNRKRDTVAVRPMGIPPARRSRYIEGLDSFEVEFCPSCSNAVVFALGTTANSVAKVPCDECFLDLIAMRNKDGSVSVASAEESLPSEEPL